MSHLIDKWVDGISRLQIVLPLGLVLGLVFLFVYPRVSSPNKKQEAISPDHNVIAEVSILEGHGATDTAYTGVRLHSRFNPFRQYDVWRP